MAVLGSLSYRSEKCNLFASLKTHGRNSAVQFLTTNEDFRESVHIQECYLDKRRRNRTSSENF